MSEVKGMTDKQIRERIEALTDEILELASQMEDGMALCLLGAFEEGEGDSVDENGVPNTRVQGFSKTMANSLGCQGIVIKNAKEMMSRVLEEVMEKNGPMAAFALTMIASGEADASKEVKRDEITDIEDFRMSRQSESKSPMKG